MNENGVYEIQIRGFTVREVFHNLTQEMRHKTEIKIDEIPEYSCLREKNKKPKPLKSKDGGVNDSGNVTKDESFM